MAGMVGNGDANKTGSGYAMETQELRKNVAKHFQALPVLWQSNGQATLKKKRRTLTKVYKGTDKDIKPDTWYKLENGEFVEVEA